MKILLIGTLKKATPLDITYYKKESNPMVKRLHLFLKRTFPFILMMVSSSFIQAMETETKSSAISGSEFNNSIEKISDFLKEIAFRLPKDTQEVVLSFYFKILLEELKNADPRTLPNYKLLSSKNQDPLSFTHLWPALREEALFLLSLNSQLLKSCIPVLHSLFDRKYSTLHLTSDLSTIPLAGLMVQNFCYNNKGHKDINSSTQGETPLTCAIRNKENDVAISLVEAGSCINPSRVNCSPLFYAIQMENVSLAAYLLSRKPALINKKSSVLHSAVKIRNTNVLSTLLEHPSVASSLEDIAFSTNEEDNTPLATAIDTIYPEGVKLLVQHYRSNAIFHQLNGYALWLACNNLYYLNPRKQESDKGKLAPRESKQVDQQYKDLKTIITLLINNLCGKTLQKEVIKEALELLAEISHDHDVEQFKTTIASLLKEQEKNSSSRRRRANGCPKRRSKKPSSREKINL